MSDRFVKDPREVAKAGEVVKVKVMQVDLQRKRIGLSMRLSDEPGREQPTREQPKRSRKRVHAADRRESGGSQGALAAAFAKARKG